MSYKKCLTLDIDNFGASIQHANLLVEVGQGQCAAKYY